MGVEGSYCSKECYYREVGERHIRVVENQSQFCNSCYAIVRDIEPVPDHVYPLGDGLQYPTPNTTHGIDTFRSRDGVEVRGTRWSCSCGNVDPNVTISELQNVGLERVISNLRRALVWLADRGVIDARPCRETYYRVLEDGGGRCAALAVGRAIEANT